MPGKCLGNREVIIFGSGHLAVAPGERRNGTTGPAREVRRCGQRIGSDVRERGETAVRWNGRVDYSQGHFGSGLDRIERYLIAEDCVAATQDRFAIPKQIVRNANSRLVVEHRGLETG